MGSTVKKNKKKTSNIYNFKGTVSISSNDPLHA